MARAATQAAVVTSPAAQLAEYRAQIDECDAQLVQLLARRFAVTEKIGELKARAHLPAADPAREKVQLARLRALAAAQGLDPAVAEHTWRAIVRAVKRRHAAIAKA